MYFRDSGRQYRRENHKGGFQTGFQKKFPDLESALIIL